MLENESEMNFSTSYFQQIPALMLIFASNKFFTQIKLSNPNSLLITSHNKSSVSAKIFVENEFAMGELGATFITELVSGDMVYFQGDLGAGKTTLVRGILNALGYSGAVTSPTYTLVESYSFADFMVFHFDLYRLESASDLEMIGLREMVGPDSICLVEWPVKGASILPRADVLIQIKYSDQGREVLFERINHDLKAG